MKELLTENHKEKMREFADTTLGAFGIALIVMMLIMLLSYGLNRLAHV